MGYEDNVRRVVPYTPGEQPGGRVIKLNTNECPYPPSPKVREAIRDIDTDNLRKYPDPLCLSLVSAIAGYYGLKDENVFTGVGSDDVLSMCFLTFFNGSDPIFFPNITYSFYDVWASVYGIPFKTVPLRDDFTLDPKLYRQKNGGIIIANPNAPTGIAADPGIIEEIVSSNPGVMVIVDEAYIDFGGKTAPPLLEDHENLLIVRTLSKSRALAGLRVGYAFGQKKAIKYLNDVKFSVNSYTLNTPSLLAGKAAIEDDLYFREIRDRVISTREWVKKELRELDFSFGDSCTNFIFASHKGTRDGETEAGFAKRIFASLKERGIYVRYFDKPLIDGYLRISIGTDEEMQEFIRVLKGIM